MTSLKLEPMTTDSLTMKGFQSTTPDTEQTSFDEMEIDEEGTSTVTTATMDRNPMSMGIGKTSPMEDIQADMIIPVMIALGDHHRTAAALTERALSIANGVVPLHTGMNAEPPSSTMVLMGDTAQAGGDSLMINSMTEAQYTNARTNGKLQWRSIYLRVSC